MAHTSDVEAGGCDCGEFPPANAGESGECEGASASAHGVAGSSERDQRNVDFRDELLAGV